MLNDIPLGYIQYHPIDRTQLKAGQYFPKLPATTVGFDQFIGLPEHLGKGYGTLFIKEFINYFHLTIDPKITTFVVDPAPINVAAIRCYEKIGFKKTTEFETPSGTLLLMRYDID